MTWQGVGARILRKEDDRLMRGRGEFVADLRFAGHERCRLCSQPAGAWPASAVSPFPEAFKDAVFTADDLEGVKPIRAVSGLRGFKVSEQPSLATDKVRYVGELVAMCVAPTPREAEDIVASVAPRSRRVAGGVRYASSAQIRLGAAARALGRQRLPGNFYRRRHRKALDAPIKVTREIHTARQCMAPIEGRGAVAIWDSRLEQLTLYSLVPDAAHRAHRPRWLPRTRRGPHSRHHARRRRRLRLQGHPAGRKKCVSAGSPCIAAIRCDGLRIGASI